ncbi:MAG: M15 family metallopeptidase [Patescibacteria group bacterium]
MKVIPDKTLIKIPVKDNGEKLTDIKSICSNISINIDPKSQRVEKLPFDTCYLRIGVTKRLCRAQKLLPNGFRIMIWSGHRAMKIQKKLYFDQFRKFKKQYPNWPKEKIKQETDKFVAPIEIMPPHTTGGAVDCTIIDIHGRQLNMGTAIDNFTKRSYTNSKVISKEAKKNRLLLINIMTKAGFVNYPPEWWHWSYGDRYWAAVLNKKFSIYKGI